MKRPPVSEAKTRRVLPLEFGSLSAERRCDGDEANPVAFDVFEPSQRHERQQ